MFVEMIPKYKYWKTDYPNLNTSFNGTPIPEFWGEKTNIIPVCIDTLGLEYKLAKREIKAIDAIRADGHTLTVDDYAEDLSTATFELYGMPYLAAATTYYLVIEGTFVVNGANYVKVRGDSGAAYGDGQLFYIDGGDVWTGQGADLNFKLYGKQYLDGQEELMVEFTAGDETAYSLRDAGARTKLGMSFLTPASAYYVTRIKLYLAKNGVPAGDLRISIHSDKVGTRVGGKTPSKDVSVYTTGFSLKDNKYNSYSDQSEIFVDGKGVMKKELALYPANADLMTNVSDILSDVVINILGKDAGDLDVAAFTALVGARTEDLCLFLDREISFSTFLDVLEAGSLFKFQAKLDEELTVDYYQAGEPGGTPHLKDEYFLSFQSWRDPGSVNSKVRVGYDEDPSGESERSEEQESTIAQYLYEKKSTLSVETYLKNSADASTLADTYLSLVEYPQKKIKFEVPGYGFNLRPTQKIKITKSRADNAGGSLDAVLFRIMSIQKKISAGTCVIVALLDSQSY